MKQLHISDGFDIFTDLNWLPSDKMTSISVSLQIFASICTSRRKDWWRFIWQVVFFFFWGFIQSFSFRFLEFYISAVKNDLSFCFPDVDGGTTGFSGFRVTPQVIFNNFFLIWHQNYKKHGGKTSYNFITEKVKHVLFNSFGISRDSRWLNWLQDI